MNSPVRENQDDVFACLLAMAQAAGGDAQRIDTHANVVFLGKELVYKAKRAVRYPFLDYSTVALRYRFCASEVVLNRRTAPDLYLGIMPLKRGMDGIIRAGETLTDPDPNATPGAASSTADWAVVMRRFDNNDLFDKMADRGELTVNHLQDLGQNIAAFHLKADQVRKSWRQIEADVLSDNLAEIAQADWLSTKTIAAHREESENLLDRIGERLNERAAQGFVRQCHGDIHLRNIVLINGQPTLFDCIEFSDDFAQIDCLYDLAFLLMDLEHRSMPGAACRLLNRYLEATGDYDGVGLLAFYTALRAQVRAKIEIATVAFMDEPESAQAHRDEASAYFSLARKALNRPPPRLIAVGGPSGSGKSTLAMAIAERIAESNGPAVLVLRSDAIRKALWGVPETQPLPQEAYTSSVSKRVYARMHEQAETALRQGIPVLLDATHTHPASRQAARDLAQKLSVPFHGIWATAPKEVLIARVTARKNDASDADANIVRMQIRNGWGELDWPEVDTSHRTDIQDEQATSLQNAMRLLKLA